MFPGWQYDNNGGKVLNTFLSFLQFLIIHKQLTTLVSYFFSLCSWLPLCTFWCSWREQFFYEFSEIS